MHSTTDAREAIIRPEVIMRTQAEKAAAFRALPARPGAGSGR
jgi:hypothetical protein